MAISLYLPRDVVSVANKVLEQGSIESPNYISSSNIAPSILKRNLVTYTAEDIVFKTSPLVLPPTHSTGDPLKARSFDFDFVVANTGETGIVSAFLLDICEATLIVEYTGVGVIGVDEELGPFTTYMYDIVDQVGTVLYNLPIKVEYFAVSSLSDKEELSLGVVTGEVLMNVLPDYELPGEDSIIVVDDVEKTVKITLYTEITPEITDQASKIGILVKNKSLQYSNIRVVGEVNYEPSLNTFYPTTTVTQDIPNLRDLLVQGSVKSYLGYSFELQPKKGILFNIETGTTDSRNYTAITSPTLFQETRLRIYDETVVVEPPITPEP